MKKFIIMIATGLLSLSSMGQKLDNSTVFNFSLDKYLGTWYEIARFDHSFERDVDYAKAEYTLNDDGTIKVVNSGIKNDRQKISKGKAKVTGTSGLLRVSFFGPFYSDYRVLMISDDYQYALVGSKSPNYLWILSREPEVPEDILNDILTEANWRGYETENLIWVKQYLPSSYWH